MIYDKLDNIEKYKNLSRDIYVGLKYLQEIDESIANGVYEVNPRVKVIVSEYETKMQNENGFEAHRQYIDIQTTLVGYERIACMPLDKLEEKIPYNEEKDIAFYSSTSHPQDLVISSGYFTIFYPKDGHMPKLCVNEPMKVKKVIVKIQVA